MLQKVVSQIRARKKNPSSFIKYEDKMCGPGIMGHQKLRHYAGEGFYGFPCFVLVPVHQQLVAIREKLMD